MGGKRLPSAAAALAAVPVAKKPVPVSLNKMMGESFVVVCHLLCVSGSKGVEETRRTSR